jgi:hypothetical protein
LKSVEDSKPVKKHRKSIILSALAIAGVLLAATFGLIGHALTTKAAGATHQGEIAANGVPEAQAQSKFNQIKNQNPGYRLTWVQAYTVNNKTYFNYIFHPANGVAWMAVAEQTKSAYQATFDRLVNQQKYRLAEVDIYQGSQGQIFYAAIFIKAPGPQWIAYSALTATQNTQTFNTLTKQGYVPVNISGVSIHGVQTYAVLYQKAKVAFAAYAGMNAASYQARFNTYEAANYNLVYLNAFSNGGTPLFIAIWYKNAPKIYARHNMNGTEYQNLFNTEIAHGLNTQAVAGYDNHGQTLYAAYWA